MVTRQDDALDDVADDVPVRMVDHPDVLRDGPAELLRDEPHDGQPVVLEPVVVRRASVGLRRLDDPLHAALCDLTPGKRPDLRHFAPPLALPSRAPALRPGGPRASP